MCPRSTRPWSSASSTPAARSRARRCANISASRAAATPARAGRCTIRASAASAPADRHRAARRSSLRARSTWRSAATRPARFASRRAIAGSSAWSRLLGWCPIPALRCAGLGAVVTDVSVPAHALGYPVWAAIRGDAACIMLLEMNGAGIGHEGLYVTSLIERAMGWRKRADQFADTLKIASIFSRYTVDRYGGRFYAKAQNLRRRVRAGYDAVLAAPDLLLLPS